MMQTGLLGNAKALLVLGLGPLEPNIFGDDLVGHVAAGRDKVATGPASRWFTVTSSGSSSR